MVEVLRSSPAIHPNGGPSSASSPIAAAATPRDQHELKELSLRRASSGSFLRGPPRRAASNSEAFPADNGALGAAGRPAAPPFWGTGNVAPPSPAPAPVVVTAFRTPRRSRTVIDYVPPTPPCVAARTPQTLPFRPIDAAAALHQLSALPPPISRFPPSSPPTLACPFSARFPPSAASVSSTVSSESDNSSSVTLLSAAPSNSPAADAPSKATPPSSFAALPAELQLAVFDRLDTIDGTCLALTCTRLYAMHRLVRPGPVSLAARREGPNALEWAWRRHRDRTAAAAAAAAAPAAAGEAAKNNKAPHRYCDKCGPYRCELHRHLRSWMGPNLEYCDVRQRFGPAVETGEDVCGVEAGATEEKAAEAKPEGDAGGGAEDGGTDAWLLSFLDGYASRQYFCFRSSPTKKHRCGRHKARKGRPPKYAGEVAAARVEQVGGKQCLLVSLN